MKYVPLTTSHTTPQQLTAEYYMQSKALKSEEYFIIGEPYYQATGIED